MSSSDQTPTLTAGNLRLRAPCLADAAARFDLGNTAEIQHMFGGDPAKTRPITQEQATTWAQRLTDTPLSWVIEHDERLIGEVGLHSLNSADARATLHIGILDPSMLGQGIGTRVMHLIARYAFGPLGLHRLSLRVIEYNTRAIAAYKKLGFVVEGRERQSAFVAGRRFDDIMMGLLAPEYAAEHGARA